MYKIIGNGLGLSVPNAYPHFGDQIIRVIIPHAEWKPEYLDICMNATKLEVYMEDRTEAPSAVYNLVSWMSCEKLWDGYKMTWQTIARDRLEDMQDKLSEMSAALEQSKADLAESQERVRTLTKAILDLAAEYGAIPPVTGAAASGAADDEAILNGVSASGVGNAESTVTRKRVKSTATEEVQSND